MRRLLISGFATFIIVFLFEFLVHGMLLQEAYEATKELWRPQDDAPMHFMMISQFLFSFILAYLFAQNYENRGPAEGVRFGIYVGLLLAAIDLGKYAYMPAPLNLVFAWMAASIGKGLGCGIVLSLIYYDSHKNTA